MTACLLVFGFISIYFYPLVLAPQLDAAQNMAFGIQMLTGGGPAEPFYRSPVYPFVLALLISVSGSHHLAILFGFTCHLGNAVMVVQLGRTLGLRPLSSQLAGCLYAVYPVCLFHSFLLLDTTFAIFLFLAGLNLILKGKKSSSLWVIGILFTGLAALTRPHFLLAVWILPLALLFYSGERSPRRSVLHLALLTVVFLTMGVVNLTRSGEFRILPWQGAYNLWTANKPGANGLYLQQEVDVTNMGGEQENPAKLESIYLFQQSHPDRSPPFDIGEMNAYWRGRFLEHAIANPGAVLRLWAYKLYALLNQHEQYNNLTYGFHRHEITFLRYNPLGWGLLFSLAAIGVVVLIREKPRHAGLLLLLVVAIASLMIVFYASSRFRLLLVPFLFIPLGFALERLFELRSTPRRWLFYLIPGLIAATVSFSSFAGINSTRTHIQDQLLLANAHADLGHDVASAQWAKEVLKDQPSRREALRNYTISYFNLALLNDPRRAQFGNWEEQKDWVVQTHPTDPVQDAILGFFWWHWGEKDAAKKLWTRIANTSHAPLASAALEASGMSPSARTDPVLFRAVSHLLHSQETNR
jgi:4-amino-4-deoxy-L-arabinose transferase-like glycosyltransferase